jgi:hypothetical protein
MAEIRVPAPNAMMTPRVFLPILNRVAIIPPMAREDVASKPHKNAFNIMIVFFIKLIKYSDSCMSSMDRATFF